MDYIPQIDFKAYGVNSCQTDIDIDYLKTLANQVHTAFSTIGFIYVKNHGISEEKIGKAFRVSETFFNKPESIKEQYKRGNGLQNHGWCRLERERVNNAMAPDRKECFDVNPQIAKVWPSEGEVPEFQDTLQGLYEDCRILAQRILHLMAIGLNLPDENYFTGMFNTNNKTYTALRSLYYPPIQSISDFKEKQMRCAEHTDYGALTILFQDECGGLEVLNRNGDYVPAPYIPDTVVVNLGDLMQRWTADKLVSTKHRVMLPKDRSKWQEARQSIVCFVHPDADCIVQSVDGTNKYSPITAADYIEKRFLETI